MMYQEIYTIAYVKMQKNDILSSKYVKPTAKLVFKNRLQKGGPTFREASG